MLQKTQRPLHIVIEGTDGSGKATQVKILKERFASELGEDSCTTIDFPRYGTPSCHFVEKYLNGGFGTAEDVGPYAGSLLYAVDRYDHAPTIRKDLAEGRHVICDRYTSANMGHQAGKIDDLAERDKYLEWLDHTEFNLLGIPRPDLTILLYVDPETNQRLIAAKDDRAYLKGKKADIHEADLGHLRKSSEAFLYVAKKYGWIVVDCAPKTEEFPDGSLLSREMIHEIVWREIQKKVLAE
ncbi:MAG TPA: thymidylate kinase [Candidatus Paceibacterota bacterium]